MSWKQCPNQGVVRLTFKDQDKGKLKTLPFCKECWAKGIAAGIVIKKAVPLASEPVDFYRIIAEHLKITRQEAKERILAYVYQCNEEKEKS